MADTLDDVLRDSLACLAEGQADPHSVWRNPTLMTAGLDGLPQGRTVVLRRFDAPLRILETHTDRRSQKFAELSARPEASLHGWDAARRVQLRLSGPVTLHTSDKAADAAWAALAPQSRSTYQVAPGPGTELAASDQAERTDEAAGRAVFCVIRLVYESLEYLHLGQGSHRRARFAWAGGARTGMWLVP